MGTSDDNVTASLRPISWWAIVIGIAAVVTATWASTAWLLAEADKASLNARAGLRIDAIRTGLSVGAGTGGVFALLLAVRRQWLNERAQAHNEEVAQITEFDATERRITDLYAKAADQLGSDKAQVRLAGCFALERLAQNNPGHRQTIVDLICAYLRMPYSEPPHPELPADAEEADKMLRAWHNSCRTDEHQVRRAAEEILTSHLNPGDNDTAPDPRFWEGMRINLQGAFLISAHFAGCRIDEATFSAATFAAGAAFDGATFTGPARFGGVTVGGGISFEGATFLDLFSFYKASVGWYAIFRGATFTRWVTFQGVTIPPPEKKPGLTHGVFPGKGFDLTGARINNCPERAVWPSGWMAGTPQPDGWTPVVLELDSVTDKESQVEPEAIE